MVISFNQTPRKKQRQTPQQKQNLFGKHRSIVEENKEALVS